MRSLLYNLFFALALSAAVGSSVPAGLTQPDSQAATPSSGNDTLAQYRDTLVGRFNGIDLDTLICEPVGEMQNYDTDRYYFDWRIYTTNGTVKDLKIGNTIGIKFVKEGDLDGNGTEEWGFITQWVTSTWTSYKLFTADDGEWKLLIEPTPIWEEHLDSDEYEGSKDFNENTIAQPWRNKGYIHIQYSKVIDDVTNWVVLDTIVKVSPRKYKYEKFIL